MNIHAQSPLSGNHAAEDVIYYSIDTAGMEPEYSRSGEPQPVLEGINLRRHDDAYKTETIEIVLQPRQQLEYMADIDQGEILLYSLQFEGRVYYDFHAHQDGVNPDIWIRYEEGQAAGTTGSLVAPYTGEHGWYLVNLDTRPVNVRLSISGYYRDIFRIDL